MQQFPGNLPVDDCIDKTPGSGCAGVGKDLQDVAHLHNAGVVNNRNPVTHLLDHVHVVGYQQNCQIEPVVNILKQFQN
ncbi:MAG: hypothetical protein BWY80_01495 [Firmicutes bacterium ADurb.Bin456]|nr:MAG: hypothetical protein BWY80_01495 [Firmicutes bacterium ADurb.Bin456]